MASRGGWKKIVLIEEFVQVPLPITIAAAQAESPSWSRQQFEGRNTQLGAMSGA